MSENYGVINEVGDLGLGFTQLNMEDQKVLKEQKEKTEKSK